MFGDLPKWKNCWEIFEIFYTSLKYWARIFSDIFPTRQTLFKILVQFAKNIYLALPGVNCIELKFTPIFCILNFLSNFTYSRDPKKNFFSPFNFSKSRERQKTTRRIMTCKINKCWNIIIKISCRNMQFVPSVCRFWKCSVRKSEEKGREKNDKRYVRVVYFALTPFSFIIF
jgi:hypothetical protein